MGNLVSFGNLFGIDTDPPVDTTPRARYLNATEIAFLFKDFVKTHCTQHTGVWVDIHIFKHAFVKYFQVTCTDRQMYLPDDELAKLVTTHGAEVYPALPNGTSNAQPNTLVLNLNLVAFPSKKTGDAAFSSTVSNQDSVT